MYICAKGKEIHLQGGENTMTKQEIKKEILKEALNYLKNKKAYDENLCETNEDDELYNDCVKIFKRTVKDDECYY